MKRVFLAATALLSLAMSGQTVQADDTPEAPYVDDRSSAEAVIQSLYSAINRHEFTRAWGYYGETKPAKDFDAFVKGYDGTDKVEVATGAVSDDGAAGSIFYSVPVAIRATDKSGEEKVFAGCYTLRQVNAQNQAAPPFDPIHIEKGALKPSTADFEEAVPASCGDGPPPPKKDTALEQAKKAFLATYGSQCDKQFLADDPEVFSIKYKDKDAQPGDAEKETRLFHFSCSAAAYNESSVYYMTDGLSEVQQLQFAEPKMDIRYEKNDSDGKLLGMSIVGFDTTGWAVNSDYDPDTHTITTFNKWRGVGDASDAGTYLFRDGDFSLVQYDVDASYDGEENPQTVVDYNTAP
ncbi:MAG: DUF1176 domain-containing protein [Mesorhizobium sp.]|nr:DUF1176 domain-containing protein [bacterium M00.F.Ca.ET.205.01.1.1]TGU53805.1 DUF1176 domain-containing protein [bacterium M00.F.Ca.ET.152.01.1.1]TGV37303.1 DUF1176 domain-containing protein [Mesorhizobium sp. M00.F.Ca.ET.186.01.1.1]TGZ41337.1 DUF1176 domain-containing protein [bacterium M00.F.Ca.ET.162.01.1.1]TIW61439.1 MAG: DUF1176 domain-containing protein [Mesorhizobium sp.]